MFIARFSLLSWKKQLSRNEQIKGAEDDGFL
ncbi:hypothetical protein LEAN103870_08705 [Legionella anisa]